MDLSQSLQGAGGIGGLLATVSGSTTDHFLYDGNGNVGQLINAVGGSLDAQYEYDPYGNLILSTGTLSASNPFRFSTKYLDTETGLYYYGYRYYSPNTGRWLTRDPIGERGGLNLVVFSTNDPINKTDFWGLFSDPWTGVNGTRAHQSFFAWLEQNSKGYITNARMEQSLLRPDVRNERYIWELKPSSHEFGYLSKLDDRQLKGYIRASGCKLQLGDPNILVNRVTNVGQINLGNTPRLAYVFVYPGSNRSRGLLYYALISRDNPEESLVNVRNTVIAAEITAILYAIQQGIQQLRPIIQTLPALL